MTWLLLDCNFLCHRALHTTGDLSHNGKPTGTIFGFLAELQRLKDRFLDCRFIFCFDLGLSVRLVAYPQYKARKPIVTKQERAKRQDFIIQVNQLRTGILLELGYRNILFQDGYEADDIIASVVKFSIPQTEEKIIVSADKDLYQLLEPGTAIWNPIKKIFYSHESFKIDYQLYPNQWPHVKALAGCKSDNIEGVPGVGDKTAARFFTDRLSTKSKAFKNIVGDSNIFQKNLPLVKLPYPGTKQFPIEKDEFSQKKWRDVVTSMGMKSLLGGI